MGQSRRRWRNTPCHCSGANPTKPRHRALIHQAKGELLSQHLSSASLHGPRLRTLTEFPPVAGCIQVGGVPYPSECPALWPALPLRSNGKQLLP